RPGRRRSSTPSRRSATSKGGSAEESAGMNERKTGIDSVSDWVRRWLLWLLLGSYAAAAFAPGLGLWVRDAALGTVALFGGRTGVTRPVLMLAFLLWNAGLGVRPGHLAGLRHGVGLLLAALAANLLVPLAFALGASQGLRLWHDPEEARDLLA